MNEKIQRLVDLSKEHPDAEIITAVDWEVVAEDWGYWKCEIKSVIYDYFYESDERWYHGKGEILNVLELEMDDYEELFGALVRQGKIKKAIIILLGV